MVCDSNILIYAADPTDLQCAQYVQRPEACIASVTRIEVLGFPRFGQLEAERQERLAQLVSSLPKMALDEEVIQRAISLRRDRRKIFQKKLIEPEFAFLSRADIGLCFLIEQFGAVVNLSEIARRVEAGPKTSKTIAS